MVSTILILALATSALVVSWKLVWTAGIAQDRYSQERLHEVDVRIFRVLIDSTDDVYLATHLNPLSARSFRRKRVVLAFRMIGLVDDDARKVIHMIQRAKTVGDPVLNRRANDLMSLAIRLRMNLVAVRFCLGLKWLMPGLEFVVPAWDAVYLELAASLFCLPQHDSPIPIRN